MQWDDLCPRYPFYQKVFGQQGNGAHKKDYKCPINNTYQNQPGKIVGDPSWATVQKVKVPQKIHKGNKGVKDHQIDDQRSFPVFLQKLLHGANPNFLRKSFLYDLLIRNSS
jgi:hypothetical protein